MKKFNRLFIGLVCMLGISTTAMADLSIRFVESAPKDSFRFTVGENCSLPAGKIMINLKGSQGNLIFDTEPTGLGVEVYQKFEKVAGSNLFAIENNITDGDQALTLNVKPLSEGQDFSFTIDVDDQLTNSSLGQIRVADQEITGASISYISAGGDISQEAVFGAEAEAILSLQCQSL